MNVPTHHIDCDHSYIPPAIKKHGYTFIDLISLRPSLSLAKYDENDYAFSILQRHLAHEDSSSEFYYWKWLDNPYCLRLYDRFTEGKYEYFVTDAVSQGNVISFLVKYDTNGGTQREAFMREATYHVLKALSYIHNEGLVHLNVEWRNVWIDRNFHFYLGGFENLIPTERYCEATYGYQAYKPPEALNGFETNRSTIQAADMWALGIGLHEVFTAQWIGQRNYRVRANEIGSNRLLLNIQENIPLVWERLRSECSQVSACNFVQSLLTLSPADRLTSDEALDTEWIRQREKPDHEPHAEEGELELPLPCLLHPQKGGKRSYISYITLLHSYRYLQTIYRGSYGAAVFQAENVINNSKVAIKMRLNSYSLRGERFHWQIMDHPSIMCLRDTFHDENYVFFVMDYMPHRDVISYLTKHNMHYRKRECMMQKWTSQVLHGLVYLHTMGFALLNFTWHQILLDSNLDAKIGNVSHVRSSQGSGPLKFGYLMNRAPETLYMSSLSRVYVDRVDMWALGASLLKILAKKYIAGHAFNSNSNSNHHQDLRKTYNRILDNLVALPKVLKRTRMSEAVQDFILKLLRLKPQLRLTSEQALQHSWIANSTSEPEVVTTGVSHVPSTSSAQKLLKKFRKRKGKPDSKSEAIQTWAVDVPLQPTSPEVQAKDAKEEALRMRRAHYCECKRIFQSDSEEEEPPPAPEPEVSEADSDVSWDLSKKEKEESAKKPEPELPVETTLQVETLRPETRESQTTVDPQIQTEAKAVQEGMATALLTYMQGQEGQGGSK